MVYKAALCGAEIT